MFSVFPSFLGSSSVRVVWAVFIAVLLAGLAAGCGDSSGDGRAGDAAIADGRDATPTDLEEGVDVPGDTGDEIVATTDSPDAYLLMVDAPDAPMPIVDAAIPVDEPDSSSVVDDSDADLDLVDETDAIYLSVDSGDALALDGAADTSLDATGDAPSASWLAPTVSGTVYTYRFGDTVFAVDSAIGGRIVTFSFGGRNILTAAKNSDDNNWGSTLWPSPQSDWNWPPPAEIDPGPYTASLAGGILTLASATATNLQLAASKSFFVDGTAGAVTIEYRLENRGSKARKVAPWEITRVAAGGLTFFPMGDGSPRKGSPELLTLAMADSVAWFAYDAAKIANDQKVYADGHEGWIAHASGNLLLLKAFTDIPAALAAPGDAEIELFTDAPHTYIELENQGAYASLAAGASLSWKVRWFLRKLDASVAVQIGSASLLGTVRALVAAP